MTSAQSRLGACPEYALHAGALFSPDYYRLEAMKWTDVTGISIGILSFSACLLCHSLPRMGHMQLVADVFSIGACA